ncbi:MAG: sulfurtransferase TusA family protein [Pseudomonadota bacterium]
MTFVRTKLLIEKMSSGQIAVVCLNSGEPLTNVPRAVREHGHAVLDLAPGRSGTAGRTLPAALPQVVSAGRQ